MSENNKKLIFSLIGALVVTFLCGKGLFRRFDIMMQDALFQKRASVPGDIVLIGIDEDDIKDFFVVFKEALVSTGVQVPVKYKE